MEHGLRKTLIWLTLFGNYKCVQRAALRQGELTKSYSALFESSLLPSFYTAS